MAKTDPLLPPDDGESQWQPPQRPSGFFSGLGRVLLLFIIAVLVTLPFTPVASKIQSGLMRLAERFGGGGVKVKEKIVTQTVVKTVEVPAPPPPLPEKFISRKEADVATFFNGMTINTSLTTDEGGYASLERKDPAAYQVQFNVNIRVPKANQSVDELSRINPALPQILPGLGELVTSSKVSGFYTKLYDNKTELVKRDLTRLNRILDRHNFFDCETILEMQHPQTGRKALLIQSEMDVVADGSDGDRADKLEDYISLSDYYQPSTSYGWAKKTKKANPLVAKWEARLKVAKEEYAKKGLSTERNRILKALISQLTIEMADMKERSYLIADSDPFVVLSLVFRGYEKQNPHTPQMGDYAVVIHDKKIYPAICGDYGPTMKMGEASLFMAKAINPKATPYYRPESDLKVTYLVFPGTAEKPFGPPVLAHWKERCASYLQELGGLGAGYELHTWEDKFAKPAAPAETPVEVAPAAAPAAEPK
jgi:hypothetical protein